MIQRQTMAKEEVSRELIDNIRPYMNRHNTLLIMNVGIKITKKRKDIILNGDVTFDGKTVDDYLDEIVYRKDTKKNLKSLIFPGKYRMNTFVDKMGYIREFTDLAEQDGEPIENMCGENKYPSSKFDPKCVRYTVPTTINKDKNKTNVCSRISAIGTVFINSKHDVYQLTNDCGEFILDLYTLKRYSEKDEMCAIIRSDSRKNTFRKDLYDCGEVADLRFTETRFTFDLCINGWASGVAIYVDSLHHITSAYINGKSADIILVEEHEIGQ